MARARSKHTKSPWIAVGARIESTNDDIADIASFDPADFRQKHLVRSYEEMAANARLGAAAPFMYEQVKQYLEFVKEIKVVLGVLKQKDSIQYTMCEMREETLKDFLKEIERN